MSSGVTFPLLVLFLCASSFSRFTCGNMPASKFKVRAQVQVQLKMCCLFHKSLCNSLIVSCWFTCLSLNRSLGGGSFVHFKIFSRIPDLTSTHQIPFVIENFRVSCDNQKCLQTLPNHFLLRITVLRSYLSFNSYSIMNVQWSFLEAT